MACGLLVVWIEVVIYLNAADMKFAGWSFYVLVPCAVLGVAAIILEHRKILKNKSNADCFIEPSLYDQKTKCRCA